MTKIRQKPFIKIFGSCQFFQERRKWRQAKHTGTTGGKNQTPRLRLQPDWEPIRQQSHDGEKSPDWSAGQLLPPRRLYTKMCVRRSSLPYRCSSPTGNLAHCPPRTSFPLLTAAPPSLRPPSWRRQVTEVCCVAAAAAAEHKSRCASLICS